MNIEKIKRILLTVNKATPSQRFEAIRVLRGSQKATKR